MQNSSCIETIVLLEGRIDLSEPRSMSEYDSELSDFSRQGYLLLPSQFSSEELDTMRSWIDSDLLEWKKFLDIRNPEQSGSLAHHVLVKAHWRAFLNDLEPMDLFRRLLGDEPVVNTFGINDNRAEGGLYHHRDHVDQKFSSDGRLSMSINLLIFVDDFQVDTGATWVYPNSISELSSGTALKAERSEQVCGHAGDLLIWDSRILHRAGANTSGVHRRAVSLMLARHWVKPQFNYLGMMSETEIESLTDIQKQLLGYESRVPSSLEDWYFRRRRRLA